MREGVPNGNGFRGPAERIPLKNRADTPERKQTLDNLRKKAEELEKDLSKRFPERSPNLRRSENKNVVDKLLEIANEARLLGKHYEGFHVGGIVLARRKSAKHGNHYLVYFDANSKPHKSSPKQCAEQYIADMLQKNNFELQEVVALAVVAENRPDDVSGQDKRLLTPCFICRLRLHDISEHNPKLLPGKTPIFLAHAENLQWRGQTTVGKLHQIHGEDPETLKAKYREV